jgi:hypothetical protein
VIEAFVLGVPFVAALVYLVVEVCELNVWWRRTRTPPPRSSPPPERGEPWPEQFDTPEDP